MGKFIFKNTVENSLYIQTAINVVVVISMIKVDILFLIVLQGILTLFLIYFLTVRKFHAARLRYISLTVNVVLMLSILYFVASRIF